MDASDYLLREMKESRVTMELLVQLVRAFQARVGLEADGKFGPDTRTALATDVSHALTEQPVLPELSESEPLTEQDGAIAEAQADPAAPNTQLPSDEWLEGVDVSRYQIDVDWPQAMRSGIDFAFVKATEGRDYTDPTFQKKWGELKEAGLIRGAYHFMRPDNNSAAAEAAHALETIGSLGVGDLPIVGDLEVSQPKLHPRQLVAWVDEWCQIVHDKSGRRPILYLSTAYWLDQLGRTNALAHWPLWLADYRQLAPDRPADSLAGWRWLFWQWTGAGRVAGYDNEIDRNVFRGTREQLFALAQLQSVPHRKSEGPASPSSSVESVVVGDSTRPLRLRALDWCLEEMQRWGSGRVSKERIAEYFAGCERKGVKLGIRSGNFCAAAMGFAERQAALSDERLPPWRAGAQEPMGDAKTGRRGRWMSITEVRQGSERPVPGALAIYWRGSPQDWRGHIERVVEARDDDFTAIGANESGGFGTGGRWVVEDTPFSHPQLLGFVVDDEHSAVVTATPEPPLHFREI